MYLINGRHRHNASYLLAAVKNRCRLDAKALHIFTRVTRVEIKRKESFEMGTKKFKREKIN